MKAVQFDRTGGPEVLKLAEVPTPGIRPSTVLVRTHAVGVNFADVLFRRGQYAVQPRLPDIPGVEAAGEVEETGDGVAGLKPGMRVALLGARTYAEHALAPASQIIPLPDFISYEQGAAFPVQVLTAWHMLHTSHRSSPGQTVLVHSAAGGVGIVAVQIAKAAGLRVIGTVSTRAKAELAKRYGADDVVNYVTDDFGAEVMRLTGNRGADLILDAVGATTFETGLKCLAPFGHLILFGRASGPPERLDMLKLSEKSIKVSGFRLPTVAMLPDLMRKGVEESFDLIRGGKLKLVIGKTYPLSDASRAHEDLESRRSTGKLLLIP